MDEEKDERKSFEKKRRNLLVVTTFLLLYTLGGAHIEKVSFPGGSIQLTRPEIVIYFAWTCFCYLLWRFWQETEGKRENIVEAYRSYLLENDDFYNLVYPLYRKKGEVGEYNTENLELCINHKQLTGIKFPNDRERLEFAVRIKPLGHWRPFFRVADFGKFVMGADEVDNRLVNIVYYEARDGVQDIRITLPFWPFLKMHTKALVKVHLRSPLFSDIAVPYLYAGGMVLAVIVEKIS